MPGPLAKSAMDKGPTGGSPGGGGAEPNLLSPFQIHFLPIVTTIEGMISESVGNRLQSYILARWRGH